MKPIHTISAVLIAIIVQPMLNAQSKELNPIDTNTVGYIEFKLDRLDLDQDLKQVEELFSFTSFPSIEGNVLELLKTCKSSGLPTVRMYVSLEDIASREGGPFWLIPVDDEEASKVKNKLELITEQTVLLTKGAIVVANYPVLNRLMGSGRSFRTSDDELITFQGKGMINLVIVPSKDHRKVIREMFPKLDDPFKAMTGPLVADGMKSVVVELNSTQPWNLKLVVTGENEDANRQIGEFVSAAIGAIQNDWLKLPFEVDEKFKQGLNAFKPNQEGSQFSITIDDTNAKFFMDVVKPTVNKARVTREQTEALMHARDIVLAMHNYADANKRLPPTAIKDEDGKPLLSWRVAILPYMNQRNLYKQFRLDEPWDSPHNRKAATLVPVQYLSRVPGDPEGSRTQWVMPSGENVVGRPDGIQFRDFTDGTSNTIMLVRSTPEAAVLWTKPDDLNIDLSSPAKGIFSEEQTSTIIVLADSYARWISNKTDKRSLRALFTVDGGEIVRKEQIK